MTTICNKFISVQPQEIMYPFELDQLMACDLQITNLTAHYVAFKVKTTAPDKYYVRPHAGVILPWELCIMRVAHQAQSEYPPTMICRDKFQILSAIVPPNTEVDGLPPDLFNRDGNIIETLKLKVVYVLEIKAPHGDFDGNVQELEEERDIALIEAQMLQQELKYLRKRRERRVDPNLSVRFTFIVGLIGLAFGFVMRLLFS